MKVPKMYKSSDRYNAGTDVIYDDDSKLQYPPFVYATSSQSGDSGGDDGDEEGDEGMLITVTDGALNKNYTEINNAVESGKVVYLIEDGSIYYLTNFYLDNSDSKYYVVFTTSLSKTLYEYIFVADNDADPLVVVEPGGD